MTRSINDKFDKIYNSEKINEYCATNAGVLPKDWQCKKISEIADELIETAGESVYETVSISAGIGFVNQAKKFGKELSGKQYQKYIVLHKGDFSYNKGNSNLYPQGCIYRLNDRETAAVPNVFESFRIKDGNTDYYEQLFASGFLNRQLYSRINRGVRDDGLLNLKGSDFYSCEVPVPSIWEQQKIAEILIQCDKVIELKEKFLLEKRKQKSVLETQLLLGKKRLRGFSGKWKRVKFGDFTKVISGGTPDTNIKEYWNGDIPWCVPSDISKAGKYISNTEKSISKNGLENSSAVLLPAGSILMCSRATIGPRSINTVPMATNQGFKSLVVDTKYAVTEYIYYALDLCLPALIRLSSGSTFLELAKKDLEKTEVLLPEIAEQKAIAEILRVEDQEIDLLCKEIEFEKNKKKALMQLLLTGTVRV